MNKIRSEHKRDKLVHIAFSQLEINELDEYRTRYNYTRTAWVRLCIEEAKLRIDVPHIFEHKLINKEIKERIWNVLLLLDKMAIDRIYRDVNDWKNYVDLQHEPLWAVGVELRRIYEGNPKGSYHHEGRPYNTQVYPCIFTSKNAWFEKNHKQGLLNKN